MTEEFDFEEIKKEVGELPDPKVTEQDINFVLNTIQKEAKHDLRLEATDKAFYPSKEVIEQSYGFRSKLSSERGGKNIFDIYRLEDHEGNEITISELIERYLSDPQTCFKVGWDEIEASDIRFTRNLANNNQSYATQILINHLHNA